MSINCQWKEKGSLPPGTLCLITTPSGLPFMSFIAMDHMGRISGTEVSDQIHYTRLLIRRPITQLPMAGEKSPLLSETLCRHYYSCQIAIHIIPGY